MVVSGLHTVTQLDQACLRNADEALFLRAVESNDDQDDRHHQHRQRSGAIRAAASRNPLANPVSASPGSGREHREARESRRGGDTSGSKALGVHVNDLIQCLKNQTVKHRRRSACDVPGGCRPQGSLQPHGALYSLRDDLFSQYPRVQILPEQGLQFPAWGLLQQTTAQEGRTNGVGFAHYERLTHFVTVCHKRKNSVVSSKPLTAL